jgi:hypothetical protein
MDSVRALGMLAAAGRNGLTLQLLAACSFRADMIAALVCEGLATLTHEKIQVGGEMTEVAKVRITDSGMHAIAAEGQWSEAPSAH